MVLDRRRGLFIATLWLALATILTHALLLTDSPMRRTSGSAFNPFTTEVALGPKRAAMVEKPASVQVLAGDGGEQDGGAVVAPLSLSVFRLALPVPGAVFAEPVGALSGLAGARAFHARAPPSA